MAHTFRTTVEIDAPVARVWQVLIAIDAWPTWTASINAATFVEGSMASGGRAEIRQPGLPPTIWTVTKVNPGVSFTWEARSPGVHTVAGHHLEPLGPARTRVTLDLTQDGMFAWLVKALTGAKITAFMQMEADGLKRQSEASAGD